MALRRAGKDYVLGVNPSAGYSTRLRRAEPSANSAHSQFNAWIDKPAVSGTAEEIAQDLDPAAWHNDASGRHTSSPGRSGDEHTKPPPNAHA